MNSSFPIAFFYTHQLALKTVISSDVFFHFISKENRKEARLAGGLAAISPEELYLKGHITLKE